MIISESRQIDLGEPWCRYHLHFPWEKLAESSRVIAPGINISQEIASHCWAWKWFKEVLSPWAGSVPTTFAIITQRVRIEWWWMVFHPPNPNDIQTYECQILPNWHLAQQNVFGAHANWQTHCPVCPSQLCSDTCGPSVFQGKISQCRTALKIFACIWLFLPFSS